ncbi:MAG: lytic transglycosylase [Desulfobacterales bacterium]|nr:MAG: lytic transglycosylase [Desulfobacterales bacterium]
MNSRKIGTFFVFLVLCGSGYVRADMYLCRDASGKAEYTNVQNGGNCQIFRLQKSVLAGYSRHSSRPVNRARYDRDIKAIARRYRLEPSLVKAIIHVESDFDHRAVSIHGAQGLMQLMPATARELRVADVFDPLQNIDGGSRYLRKILDIFKGDLRLSLAAYNAGPGVVRRTGRIPQDKKVLRYIDKVLDKYKMYKIEM